MNETCTTMNDCLHLFSSFDGWLLPLQFFNTIFWQCSLGICVDRSVDDVGFIETVMQDLPNRLAVNRKQVRERPRQEPPLARRHAGCAQSLSWFWYLE